MKHIEYKATIIIPCYNKEKYIRKAIESILSLSRFEEFEIIIVDDHSSDNSVDIINEYTQKYENIRLIVLEQGSGSASKPRNTGIANSTAPYLIFMDPDDYIINDGYSVLLSKMEEYDSDILIGTRVGMTLAGQIVFTDFIDDKFTYINSDDYDVRYDLLCRPPFILKTIYKKSLILDNDIVFNEKISTSEDESFDMMCASYAKKITKINDIVYCYTVEAPGSTTTEVSMKMYKQLYDIMVELEKAYTIYFSREVAMDRIAHTIFGFYAGRIAFFKTREEIDEALANMQKAVKDFGYEKFLIIEDEQILKTVTNVYNGNYVPLLERVFLVRIRALEARLKKVEKDLKKSNKKLKKTNKELGSIKSIQNRKTVKAAVKLSNTMKKIKQKL